MSSNVAASVRQRLLNQAKQRREEFERTLVRYADERLLFRLGASTVRNRCVLKGASLLTAWMRDPHRATRDVDLLAFGATDDNAIRAIIHEICAVPCPEDGLTFDTTNVVVDDIRAAEEYAGRRARFVAMLGAARIRVQMDFGVGDTLTEPAQEIEYPTILANLPAPQVRAYPREASVAEKFEAMVALDVRNRRMKDFHDIWALSETFAFDGRKLRTAVQACFETRRRGWTAEAPPVLTAAFYQRPELRARWQAYLESGGVAVRPPAQVEEIGERVVAFLGPIRESIVAQDEFSLLWTAGGSWVSFDYARSSS